MTLLSGQYFCKLLSEHHSFIATITVYFLLQMRFTAQVKNSMKLQFHRRSAPTAKLEASYIFTAFHLPIFRDIERIGVLADLKTRKAHLGPNFLPFSCRCRHSILLDFLLFF